ncbi:MAG: PIN domain-containing protein [Chloroherpetonaceae bacterium]|nr:PIN domain-containing protein [Chloroherpetonaceae bacterium]
MTVIVDTNILFSALLKEKSRLRDAFFEKGISFYAPNYLFIELFRYKEKILKFGKLSDTDFYDAFNGLIEKIQFVQIELISTENRQKAYDLCREADVKDTLFVALTLELNGILWTGDKKLKKHLSEKGFTRFFIAAV